MVNIAPSAKEKLDNIGTLLYGYGRHKYNVDTKMISDDIDKLDGLLDGTSGRGKTAENIKIVRSRLDVMRRVLGGGKVDLKFALDNCEGRCKIRSKPIQMFRVPEFKVETTDYLVLGGETMLEVNFRNVLDAIAWEMSYQDAGLSMTESEGLLKDFSIVGLNDGKDLGELVNGEYQRAKNMRVLDSPFMTPIGMGDYFGTVVGSKNGGVYYDALVNSAQRIGVYVLYEVLKRLHESRVPQVWVAAVYEDAIMLVTDNRVTCRARECASVDMVAEIHSRKFKFQTDILV